MKYKAIGIQLTNFCNIACSMCCFSCSKSTNEDMGFENIKKIIDEVKELDEVMMIGFTGGEPFAKYKLLIESAKYAKERGINFTISTNGSWGKDKKTGLKKIQELKRFGLKKIHLSYDEYHEEYIEHQTILSAIDLCTEVGITCEIGMCFRKNGKKPSYFVELLGERVFNRGIVFQPMLPIGRAIQEFEKKEYFANWTICKNMTCPNLNSKLGYFDVEGNFFPCCSQGVFETYLSSGNIKEESLAKLINRSNNNAYLYILYSKGFKFFVDVITEKLRRKLPSNWVGPCDFCHFVFSDYYLIEQIKPYVDEEIGKIINEEKRKRNSKSNCI
ncbi:MAG: radical SAM protein [Eubacteriaceae bacterium]